MSATELPEGGEWATSPLLDQSNVGKWMWTSWNSNRYELSRIEKIGRTNVHVGRWGDIWSLRVDPDDDGLATGTKSGFSVSAQTNERQERTVHRASLVALIQRRRWWDLSTETLEGIVALLQSEDSDGQ